LTAEIVHEMMQKIDLSLQCFQKILSTLLVHLPYSVHT
jgi:hypothetical protein